MIDDITLIRLAQKYDENFLTKEEYEKCKQDPDCNAKLVEDAAARQRAKRERDKLNPESEMSMKARERARLDNESRIALRQSGSLDGLAYKLGNQVATLKSELRKRYLKLSKNPVSPEELERHPFYQQVLQDSSEFYHLRDRVMELSQTLKMSQPGAPLIAGNLPLLLEVRSMCQDYLKRFIRYKGISSTIHAILSHIRTVVEGA